MTHLQQQDKEEEGRKWLEVTHFKDQILAESLSKNVKFN